MDGRRFDAWTRNRARRLSRRNALRLIGAGGAAATLPALESKTLAQGSCNLTFHAQIIAGPSAPTTYDGVLQFVVAADGALSQASFTPSGGAPAPANGSLTGRAFDLAIALGSGQTLVLSGTTDQKGPACPTAAAGILAGPQPADLGGWQAMPSNGQSTSGSGSNTNGQISTACPSGAELCGGSCVPSCAGGQGLDPGTCACPPTAPVCIESQQPCQSSDQCCSGFCGNGACFDCSGIVCGDSGCVDPSNDSQNCGACGAICSGACVNGACACLQDGVPCEFSDDCCSNQCGFNGLCGCVQLGEGCGASGDCCGTGDGQLCLNGVCVLSTGQACTSGAQCFDGACVNGVCGCLQDGAACQFSDDCCGNQCGFNGFCGCVQLGQGCGATADCCGNANGQVCVNGICVVL